MVRRDISDASVAWSDQSAAPTARRDLRAASAARRDLCAATSARQDMSAALAARRDISRASASMLASPWWQSLDPELTLAMADAKRTMMNDLFVFLDEELRRNVQSSWSGSIYNRVLIRS